LFTEHELDPEYRYILEQGEAMGNRFNNDPLLGPFYRMIAESERRELARHKKTFSDDDAD